MTTANEIIDFAYREANTKDIKATPTTEELSEGLTLLQSIVDSLHGVVVGIKVMPWPVPYPQRVDNQAANYPALPGDWGLPAGNDAEHPPANVRILARNTADTTIWMQYQPENGALVEYVDAGHSGFVTLNGNGAFFGLTGGNTTVEIDPAGAGRNPPRRWVYREDYACWLEITNLALTSDMPFPQAFDDFFVTELAIRLSPRFGPDPRPATLLRNKTMHQYISHQWIQSKKVLVGDAGVPSKQNYGAGRFGDNFNTGALR